MDTIRTPKTYLQQPNERKLILPRTPTKKEWNTLQVNHINVRCSTPILGDFRSPNLSPINRNTFNKTPSTSPMMFKKQLTQQQPKSNMVKRQLGENINNKSSSDDNYSDESIADSSVIRETRRRSIAVCNHSYVVNHAANVQQVLMRLGLENYIDSFEQAHIELPELATMEHADLIKIGIRKDEDCSIILEALKGI
ncbi:protein matrimony [Drosophila tropicalis]|uniref:protein matrimony n=1 Tax=Drosophila tropicalis TaxID=46794 RepID=UPI0035AC2576